MSDLRKERKEVKNTRPFKRLEQLLTYGNIWLYILSTIKRKGKAYAYALDTELDKEFEFKPSKVMLYLVLYKLEGEGIIKSEMEDRRKYYKMTKKGEETLNIAKKHLADISKRL